ncbi:tyrosine-type recombinase/integrase [Vibrio breoganii]
MQFGTVEKKKSVKLQLPVDPIRKMENVERIGHLLEKRYSQQLADIWFFSLNTALRISDTLKVRYSDIKGIMLESRDQKTNKANIIELNEVTLEIVNRTRAKYPHDTFLFQSRNNRGRGNNLPISRGYVYRCFKSLEADIDEPVRIGTHTCRKTFGYHLYKELGDLALVQQILNHSSQRETLRYIGITSDVRNATFRTRTFGISRLQRNE